MSKPQGLVKRGNRYEHRRRVPRELQPLLGKTEIKRSLKTSDYKTAKRLNSVAAVEINRILAQAEEAHRLQLPVRRFAPLNLREAEARIHRFVDETACKYVSDLQDRNDEANDNAIYDSFQNKQYYEDPAHPITSQNVDIIKSQLFDRSDLRSLSPIEQQKLYESIRRALLEIDKRTLHWLLHGEADRTFDRRFAQPRQVGISLGTLSEEYLADYRSKGKAGAKRTNSLVAAHEIIKRYFGPEILVCHIDRRQCREYVNLLNELPSNPTKHFEDRSLSLETIVCEGKAKNLPTLGRNTQETYLRALKMLLEWAVKEGHINRNPATELEPLGRAEPANEARDPFDSQELSKIFSAPLYARPFDPPEFSGATPEKRPSRFWIPLIACFSGMRANEICQLQVSDLRTTPAGTAYFEIEGEVNPSKGQKKIKNRFGKRRIPVHPELVRAGLLTYAHHRGGGALFPEIKPDTHGDRSNRISRWFNENFLTSLGLKTKKKVLHSFRHTFRDALRRIEAPIEIVDALGGWNTTRGASKNYGAGYDADQLAAWVRKVSFDNLDLSHLYPTSPPASI